MAGYLEKLKMKKRLPHALPKLPKGENTPTHGTAKTAKRPFDSKDSKGGRHISEKQQEIPAPNPPGLGPEYDRLWKKAWPLADWIDDPAAAALADRKARLPELLLMRDRMAEIERQGGTGSTPTEGKPPDYCPARCKRTGRCYGGVWFEGRPSQSSVCMIDDCFYTKNHIRNI